MEPKQEYSTKPVPGQTLTMMVGLPGSGKTYTAQKIIEISIKPVKRVNKDDLRAMIDNGKYSRENEKFINDMEMMIVDCALFAGYDVIVDDTNLKATDEQKWTEVAYKHQCAFIRLPATTPLEVCIERDAQRAKPVGRERITEMYKLYLKEVS